MTAPAFLRGERVHLRPLEADDLPFVRRLSQDPVVREPLGAVLPYTDRQQTEWFESLSPEDFTFLVYTPGTPTAPASEHERVGVAELADYFPQWGVAEVRGYVAPDHWDRGYATETLGLLCAYAFDTLGLHRLHATTQATNEAARRALGRNGFLEEGVSREHAFVRGDRVDVVRYGLLAPEWREQAARDDA
ncbi:GNAT family N-acetyltransferase [Salinirubellus salinus]|uniref:GNAT family N-acetyltransferase n=1 Tax=Salinirubellus salinus TaxID=1364945 RepID=A0A9E7R3J3_9EURY|nr:GNAT family protein [Salinirubellus salinus]UWM55146.1 GNAT family N-acetyltransferase [Salinirubellus salinus]